VIAAPAPIAWVEPATGMEFVRVPAGRFVMGTPAGEAGREAQETAHAVTLTRAFLLGRFEVTQAQWERVMGTRPSRFAGDGARPVESVSRTDVEAFLAGLARLSPGSVFRLPTEAEWEYACRAGTATAYASGDTLTPAQANVRPAGVADATYGGHTLPVGSFAPNAWGLFDMSGNVWEWTADAHCPYPEGAAALPRPACPGPLAVIRGGSWYFQADSARCGLRYTHAPGDRGFSLGFRAVREPAPSPPAPAPRRPRP